MTNLGRRVERLEVAVQGGPAGSCPVCGGRPFTILPAAEVDRLLAELGDVKDSAGRGVPVCHCHILSGEEVDRRIALLNLEPVAEAAPGPAEGREKALAATSAPVDPPQPEDAPAPALVPSDAAREAAREAARARAEEDEEDERPRVGFRW